MLQYNDWMSECVRALEITPLAAPSDPSLIAFVRLINIADNINIAFSFTDSAHIANLSQIPTQHMVGVFQARLDQWKQENEHLPASKYSKLIVAEVVAVC